MAATATLATKNVTVTPGGEAVCEVRVRNSGTVVDQFSLEVLGDAAAWSLVEPAVVPLFPGAEAVARVRFRPPKSSSVRAGSIPFAVRVKSREDARASLVEEGTVEVGPFNDTFAELIPRTAKGRARGRARLAVDNRGNVRINTRLTAADPDRKLNFAIAPQALSVEPGAVGFASIRLSPRQRFLTGPPKVSPYKANVHQDGLPTITVDGSMQQEGLIPPWAIPAAIAALALLLVLAILWLTVLHPALVSQVQQATNNSAALQQANANSQKALAAASAAQQKAGGGTAVSGPNPVGGQAWTSRLAINYSKTGDSKEASITVPDGGGLAVTDLVFENPSGNTGTLYLFRRVPDPKDPTGKAVIDQILFSIRLENFRDFDLHFVAPPVFDQKQSMVLKCDPDPDPSLCNASVTYSGYFKNPPSSP